MDNTEYTTAFDLFTVSLLSTSSLLAPDEAHCPPVSPFIFLLTRPLVYLGSQYGVAIAGLILRRMEPSATLIMLNV